MIMSDSEREECVSNINTEDLYREEIMELEGIGHDDKEQHSGELQFNVGISSSSKHVRVDDDMEWTMVGSNGKKFKDDHNKIEVYVSCLEKLPKQFGLAKIFKEHGICDAIKIKYINPYRLRVEFDNELSAEKLITCDNLISMGWRIFKSMEVGYSYGIIKNVDTDINEEQILQDISCPSPAKLISVQRLNRRDHNGDGWMTSETVRLCFKGPFLPAYVVVDNLRINVDKYVFPVSQCSRCWKIGHTIKKCARTKLVCPKCSGDHSNCETHKFKCSNCLGEHMALSRECPVYQKERKIRLIMAEFNCTYRKALTMYPTSDSPHNSPPATFRIFTQPSAHKSTEIPQSTQTPCFAEVVKGTYQNKQLIQGATPKKTPKPKSKIIPRKFDFKNWDFLQSDTESVKKDTSETRKPSNEQSSSEQPSSEKPSSEQPQDANITLKELFRRLEQAIFSNTDNFITKIQNVFKIIREWLIIWCVGNISQWPLLKSILNFTFASDNA